MAQMIRQSGIKMQEEDDIESVWSIEDKPSDSIICAIPACLSESSKTDSDYLEIQMMQAKVQNISDTIPVPHIPVKIYLDKYSKPITIIAFIDTGAAETIMNPDVLPPEWWKPHVRKDVVVGFDLYTKARQLRILPDGVRFKNLFQPFVKTPNLFSVQAERILHIVQELKIQSYADSHSEFLKKCSNPLWKNSDFFIHLPFKKNRDINPTKANHQCMNPDHLLLAEQECQELQQQDLIELSDSQWACEAFYVNKRSEQIRGKLRLVINYQWLNYFFQDDKFPLPNKDLLFSSLAKKVMIKVFHPLMKNALVYIDDILLYSQDEESHVELLENFRSLIHKYGIMLSERKMQINKSEIEFLRMDIKGGRYSPGAHITQELLKFPSKNLSFKQKAMEKDASVDTKVEDSQMQKSITTPLSKRFLLSKEKIVPHPQLLRWAEWFSQFKFDARHIKGKQNVLADLLSRPKNLLLKPKLKILAYRKIFQPRPVIMYRSSSSSSTFPTTYPVAPNLNPEFPPEIQVFKNFGGLILRPWGVHSNYPFIKPIKFELVEQPDEDLDEDIKKLDVQYRVLQKFLCQLNKKQDNDGNEDIDKDGRTFEEPDMTTNSDDSMDSAQYPHSNRNS
ncbi:hypothetical protein CXB51_021833 [Gossypium anomalum]|uniref:Reverse transcriptase domain-containing protein n=1 Tax=Gossypium anomalum TaxID=47600 RepID=A0A8J5YY94_9ROSI|nr:hypothetical protein CXB51_021833 [Gossypium anomalum]